MIFSHYTLMASDLFCFYQRDNGSSISILMLGDEILTMMWLVWN